MTLLDVFRPKKYPTIEVESDGPGPNYIDLLLEEKDKRIRDLEMQIQILQENKTWPPPTKEFDLSNQPKPVASFIPFSQLKQRLESHYHQRAMENKKKAGTKS